MTFKKSALVDCEIHKTKENYDFRVASKAFRGRFF